MDVMTLAAKLTLNTSEFDSGLDRSEQKMKGVSSGSVAKGNIISGVITKAAGAVKHMGESVVRVGMDFDSTMSQVQALGKLSNDNFFRIRQKAMELGASTKFTATQVGEAFSYMAIAGWNTDEMLAGIDGVLNLAAASGEDLARTSDIVTDALTAFGLKAEDAEHFVNVLAVAATNSNTTVAQMGEAFKYLATTGGMLGYTVDDVAMSLGLLANNGIKASQAGTSMRKILNTLISPTEDAQEAMEALGVSLFDPETDARKPLRQVVQELRDIYKEADFDLEGQTPEQIQEKLDELDQWYEDARQAVADGGYGTEGAKAAYDDLAAQYADKMQQILHPNESFLGKLSDIGGLRGISSMFALMMSNDEDINQLIDAIEQADEDGGAASQMASTMLDNLKGDITIMNSALEGLQIVVSDEFKESLRGFVQMLTEEIGNLNQAFQQNGLLGLFTNLANWVIDGVTDALSNPNEEQIMQFGEAIGTFIGQVVAKLVTSLPSLVSGAITIGESLAGGLITGLFNGLFGENTEASQLVQGLENQLSGIEVNNVRAVGLINFLHDLAEAGDENVTKTEAWQTAVEELEKIMPGVKQELEREGQTLLENIEHVRAMTGEFRQQAIQQAMTNTLAAQYQLLTEKGVERAREEVKVGVAQSEQEAVMSQLLGNTALYARYIKEGIESGEFQDFGGDMSQKVADILKGKYSVGGEYFNLADMNAEQLVGVLKELTTYLDWGDESIWNLMQDYLSPEEIEALKSRYDEAGQAIDQSTEKMSGIDTEMQEIKDDISLTEQAVGSVTQDLLGTSEGVSEAGDAVVDSLNNLAGRIDGTSPEGDSDGSHAKGLWSVPYDDYTATLHRGEMVLTSSQARRYRDGSSFDMDSLISGIVGAVQTGMSGATVNSYLNGKSITQDVSRNTIQQTKARRFAP